MRITILAFVAVLFTGCSPKVTVYSEGGNKVATDASGNMSVTDKDGNRVDYQTNKDGSWSAKSSKGEEFRASKDGISMTDEKGQTSTMGLSSVSEAELGLPFYPGSVSTDSRDMKVEADGGKTFVSVKTTSDTPSKVIDFYKGKIKDTTVSTAEKFGTINGKLEDGRKVMVMAMGQDSGKTEIQISVSSAKN